MAVNWWKYGLCVFGGLGVGLLIGTKTAKNRAEEEYEDRIESIREIYRAGNKARKPVKKKEEEPKESEQPDISAKTSIQTEQLSKRKERADQAANRYAKAFDKKEGKPEEETEQKEAPKQNWKDYIHVVEAFPEDSTYRQEVLYYYMDGVLAYQVTGQKLTDEEIEERIGEETLTLLEDDACNQIFVRNDLYMIDYTIIFNYQQWAEVTDEEPYKETL